MSIVTTVLGSVAHPVSLIAGALLGQIPAVGVYIKNKFAKAKTAVATEVSKVETKL